MSLPVPADKKLPDIGKRMGGKRPGAGRPKGAKNKRTLEIEAAAKEFAPVALQALAEIAQSSESDSARVAASSALLDRAYGKPRQAHEHTGEGGGPVEVRVTHRVVRAD